MRYLALAILFVVSAAHGQVLNQTPAPTSGVYVPLSGGAMTGTLTTTGKIGIATGTPVVPLDAWVAVSAASSTVIRMNNNGSGAAVGTTLGFALNQVSNVDLAYISSQYATNGDAASNMNLVFANGGGGINANLTGTPKMTISGLGHVLIATTSYTSATEWLNVVGAIRQSDTLACATGLKSDATGIITGCVASDRALKKNIAPLPYDPKAVDSLRAVTYEWKDQTHDDKDKHAGFIAQEVGLVFPRAVVQAGNGMKGIDSNAMVALLVQELQDLRKRVAKLEAK